MNKYKQKIIQEYRWASLVAQTLKESAAMQETWFDPWVKAWRKIPWRRQWQSTPIFLPGKSHRQRSLAGCSSKGGKESDMTEQLTHRRRKKKRRSERKEEKTESMS